MAFWKDRCVIITGASRGIGRALAADLGQRGALLGLIARNEEKLVALQDELTSRGVQVSVQAADVCDAVAIADSVRRIESGLGPCGVAIANAGVYRKTSVTNYDAAAANAVLATNLIGASNLFAAVTAGMVERRNGNLAAISSVAGMLGLPGAAAYCASKAGVSRLCDSLRIDLYDRGVRVTAISPGYVDTDMITDEERRTLKHIVPAADAARRIAHAIERGRPALAFPWQTWLEAKAASLLPFPVYRRVMKWLGEMEEVDQA
jgi:short-subunit dehydrogenase